MNALLITARSNLQIGVKTRFRTRRLRGEGLRRFLGVYLGDVLDAKPTEADIDEAHHEILTRFPDELGVRIKDVRECANAILARKARPMDGQT
jgi:hypothetical protein